MSFARSAFTECSMRCRMRDSATDSLPYHAGVMFRLPSSCPSTTIEAAGCVRRDAVPRVSRHNLINRGAQCSSDRVLPLSPTVRRHSASECDMNASRVPRMQGRRTRRSLHRANQGSRHSQISNKTRNFLLKMVSGDGSPATHKRPSTRDPQPTRQKPRATLPARADPSACRRNRGDSGAA
jgi:hypothetical protein